MMWTLLAPVTHKAQLHLALQTSDAMEELQICVHSPSEMLGRIKYNALKAENVAVRDTKRTLVKCLASLGHSSLQAQMNQKYGLTGANVA